jgi:hypothetical protein
LLGIVVPDLLTRNPPGLTMAHKIQNVFKMDDRIEHVLYEKNVQNSETTPGREVLANGNV